MLLNTTFRQMTINIYTKQGNKEKQIEGKTSTKLALTSNLNNITNT